MTGAHDTEQAQQLAQQRAFRDGYVQGALDATRHLVIDPLRAESDRTLAALCDRDQVDSQYDDGLASDESNILTIEDTGERSP